MTFYFSYQSSVWWKLFVWNTEFIRLILSWSTVLVWLPLPPSPLKEKEILKVKVHPFKSIYSYHVGVDSASYYPLSFSMSELGSNDTYAIWGLPGRWIWIDVICWGIEAAPTFSALWALQRYDKWNISPLLKSADTSRIQSRWAGWGKLLLEQCL